ncbi:MAG: hypothetical protein NTU88_09545 [Armatimonadetes bacterium]|nr:hypothetical protein [Armatimonadota bacterium]
MWDRTRQKVELELSLLHRLINHYRELTDKAPEVAPDSIQIAALGSFLHSFYTGSENIFKRIAREIDGSLPKGERWHTELLVSMAQPSPKRPAAISEGLLETLLDYLEFRHVFRLAYGFELDWEKMEDLVLNAERTLDELEAELRSFFSGDAPDEAT